MVRRRGACRVLPGKPKGKRPFGTPRRRWEDNIEMDGGGAWIVSIWLRIRTGGRLL